jgi:TnpA family transposase
VLNTLARNKIKPRLITENWDDLLRVAGSLKLGKLSASELMRTFQSGKKVSTLTKALGELGRIVKTLFLLSYIDDETYRRRILIQLNRGELRHSLARVVFHGNRGELRQPYREGQEDQLGALGLVLNILVLWNTRYMNLAIEHLRTNNFPVLQQDLVRLSPLTHSHINLLGRYSLILPENIRKGELRPLRTL